MIQEDNLYVENNSLTESEMTLGAESNPQAEVVDVAEVVDSSEVNNSASSGTGSSSGKSKVNIGIMTALLSAVVVVITVIISGISNYVVGFNKLDVYATTLSYDIDVSFDYTVDDTHIVDFATIDTGLRLILVNSTTEIIVPLNVDSDLTASVNTVPNDDGSVISVSYNFAGEIDGLAEGTFYKLEVINDVDGETEVYYSQDVKTLGGKVTQFNAIDFECRCCIDGNAYFMLDYIDENQFYTNFRYAFVKTDDDSYVCTYVPIIDTKSQVTIRNVDKLWGNKYTLIIEYDSTAYSDTGDTSGTTTKTIQQKIDVTL